MSTRVPDNWDDQEFSDNDGKAQSTIQPKKQNTVIKDDWDDDDAEDEVEIKAIGTVEESSQATPGNVSNVKLLSPKPKPPAVSPTSNNSGTSSPLPPELSFEPQFKILKREKPSGPQSSTSSSLNDRQTLQEREEKYRLARERIFGSSEAPTPNQRSPSGSGRSTPARPPNASRAVEVPSSRPVREPLGPGSQVAFMRRAPPG